MSPQSLPKAWGATPEAETACAAELADLRNEGVFTPPSLKGSVILPGNVGGVNWGGVSYDPERGLAVTAVNTIAAVIRLVPKNDRGRADFRARGRIGDDGAIMRDAPYALTRFFLATPKGEFCTPPPHGALVAVDLRAGRIAWSVPLAIYRAWERRFHSGEAKLETHPGYGGIDSEYDELKTWLDGKVEQLQPRPMLYRAKFRTLRSGSVAWSDAAGD